MKLVSLRAIDFAAIAKAEIEYGAGLNVLYGPNDLGKSTLAQCIRAVLLLPHASSFSEQFVPWRGGHLPIVERLAAESAAMTAAAEDVDRARHDVARIQKLAADVDEAERAAVDLDIKRSQAEHALEDAQKGKAEADAALQSALEAARAAGSDAETGATVARQRLELRRAAADKALGDAQRRTEDVAAAQKTVVAAASAETALRTQEAEARRAQGSLADATSARDAAEEQLRAPDVLERALAARAADEQVAAAQAAVDKAAFLRTRIDAAAADRDALRARRESIVVPDAETLPGMCRLATELASARGALDVGLFVTVTPHRDIEIRVQKDAAPPITSSGTQVVEIEAGAQVEVELGDLATVHVAGGRREAQRKAEALEERWRAEVLPRLAAAGVPDLDELDVKIRQARELESQLHARQAELASLQEQLEAVGDLTGPLGQARERQAACQAALEGAAFDTLSRELNRLGPDPNAALRTRREQAARGLEAAHEAVTRAGTAHALAEERGRMARAAFEEAVAARDAALLAFPDGLAATRQAAERALFAAAEEQRMATSELASLDNSIAAEHARVEAAVSNARKAVERALAQRLA